MLVILSKIKNQIGEAVFPATQHGKPTDGVARRPFHLDGRRYSPIIAIFTPLRCGVAFLILAVAATAIDNQAV